MSVGLVPVPSNEFGPFEVLLGDPLPIPRGNRITLKTLMRSALAASIAAGGVIALTSGTAGAAKPIITAGAGSSISCAITKVAHLSVPLMNDWVASAHASDPVAAVAALANRQYAQNGPVLTTIKGGGTCTGTVTDGTNSATVTSVKFSVTDDPAHLGNTGEATCTGLVLNSPPSTTEFDSTISYKTTDNAKIAPTTIVDQTLAAHTFNLVGGTVSGSFSGGSVAADGVPDSTTVTALSAAAPTSASPTPASNKCQPTLKVKTGKTGTTATLAPPKGLKVIHLAGPIAPNAGSSFTASA